jgi:nitrite reductase/ring-hydroxylating ferredoxin subunit
MENRLQTGRHRAVSRALCKLDEIAEPGAKGFELPGEDGPRYIFVVRTDGGLYGYVNSCPHLGTPLDLMPDRFLTEDGSELICATHGARFEIASGRCTSGPCHGDSLEPVALSVADGQVVLDDS